MNKFFICKVAQPQKFWRSPRRSPLLDDLPTSRLPAHLIGEVPGVVPPDSSSRRQSNSTRAAAAALHPPEPPVPALVHQPLDATCYLLSTLYTLYSGTRLSMYFRTHSLPLRTSTSTSHLHTRHSSSPHITYSSTAYIVFVHRTGMQNGCIPLALLHRLHIR